MDTSQFQFLSNGIRVVDDVLWGRTIILMADKVWLFGIIIDDTDVTWNHMVMYLFIC